MNPNLPAHMMNDEPADDACVDGYGKEFPDHDYPPVGWGDECRRCGAQADDGQDAEFDAKESAEKAAEGLTEDEIDAGLNSRLSSALGALRDATGTN